VNQSADLYLGGPVWSLDSAPKFFSTIYICIEGEKTSLTLTSNGAFHNFDTNKGYTRSLSLYFTSFDISPFSDTCRCWFFAFKKTELSRNSRNTEGEGRHAEYIKYLKYVQTACGTLTSQVYACNCVPRCVSSREILLGGLQPLTRSIPLWFPRKCAFVLCRDYVPGASECHLFAQSRGLARHRTKRATGANISRRR